MCSITCDKMIKSKSLCAAFRFSMTRNPKIFLAFFLAEAEVSYPKYLALKFLIIFFASKPLPNPTSRTLMFFLQFPR